MQEVTGCIGVGTHVLCCVYGVLMYFTFGHVRTEQQCYSLNSGNPMDMIHASHWNPQPIDMPSLLLGRTNARTYGCLAVRPIAMLAGVHTHNCKNPNTSPPAYQCQQRRCLFITRAQASTARSNYRCICSRVAACVACKLLMLHAHATYPSTTTTTTHG